MFEDLSSRDPKVKYGAAKSLLSTAQKNPSALYPHIDYFVKLLDSDNKIIKWTAIDIIGHIVTVDEGDRIAGLLGKLYSLLNSGNLITANHAIGALAGIASTKPAYQNKITGELLKVERYDYDTDECRNIALGKVILAISQYFNQLKGRKAIIEFVQRQTGNTRNATRKKAEEFLRKYADY